MPSLNALFAAASALAFVVSNAHMTLNTPPPYGNPSNGPLDPSGSDFPCKSTSNSGGPVTSMQIGSTQQLSFKGSAVHGGGSCQVSLTTDNPATKNSKWQVIHSIEGGCPSKTASGNLGSGAGDPGATDLADKYNFKIPAGIKAGTYTLAWTWFNKIGNREMYMNCANVKITGGSKRRDYNNETFSIPELTERDTSFPDLFKANIGGDCHTKDSANVAFPQPGSSVDHFGPTEPPTGSCAGGASAGGTQASTSGSTDGTAAGSSSGGASSGQSGQSSSGSTDAQASPPSSGSGSASGADSAGAAPSQAAASGASPSGGTVAAAASGSAPSGSASTGSSTGSSMGSGSSSGATTDASTGSGAGSTSCTTVGQVVCSADKKQIGICDATKKASMEPVPAGTVCSPSGITWGQKRAFGRARRSWELLI